MESTDIDPYLSLLTITLNGILQPFTLDIAYGLLAMVLLLFCSAMVSGSEIAFFSLKPINLDSLQVSEKRSDKLIIKLLERPKQLLATILISNNFINVAIIILSTYITTSVFNFDNLPAWLIFTLQVIVVTSMIVLVGEILPKIYATRQAERFARYMASPLNLMMTLFYPFSMPLVKSTSIIDKRIYRKGHNISISELSDAIDLTHDSETPEEDTKILKGIVKFGDIEVTEIMKARVDVVALDIEMSFKELLEVIIESGYSRIPVYKESFDNVQGILYVKDLLPHHKEEDFEWQNLLRDAFFVPENKKIDDLLREFQERKIHLAIVVDEYGGTSGLVSLEDIIEEIVGEISDEHDMPSQEVLYTKIDEYNYVFEGKTSINDFCKILGLDDKVFEDVKGEFDSVAGLILELMGRIPKRGEETSYGGFIFAIKMVDKRRIKKIQVTLNASEND